MIGYNVVLKNKIIDTVFYQSNIPLPEIRESLIKRDGYHPNILVTKARSK